MYYMNFRSLTGIRNPSSFLCGHGSPSHGAGNHQALLRISRLFTSPARGGPFLCLGGALGALAVHRLQAQACGGHIGQQKSSLSTTKCSAIESSPLSESTAERSAQDRSTESSSNSSDAQNGGDASSASDREIRKSASHESTSLRLNLAAVLMPHPEKAARGGEDAVYLADDGLSFGIADGVGGWIELGVDSGIYARALMENCKQAASRIPPSRSAPLTILANGFYDTNNRGSSTACVAVLDGDRLHAANLGDSGLMILRNNTILCKTRPQQHSFNLPFQLCKGGSRDCVVDPPNAADNYTVQVRAGDVIVAATDGVWDNVHAEECASLVHSVAARGDSPGQLAEALARYAHMRASDPRARTPFSIEAAAIGVPDIGGKMDDIAVVIAYVVPAAKL